MSCTEAQLKANRKNAERSTGPRTEAGKARSRGNAVKHGLSGEGLGLPVEDAAELDERFDALADALRPLDEQERLMTRRAALLALRLDRCASQEAATLKKAVRDAVADYDEKLMADVRAIADTFPEDPAGAVRKLKRTAQGVDFLVDHWQALRDEFDRSGRLNDSELERAEQLQGRRRDASGICPVMRLVDASAGHFVGDGAPVENLDDRKAAARRELDALFAWQIDRLEAHRLTLRHGDAELDRLEAPMRAVVDLSPRGQLLRRYENAAARELSKIFAFFDARSVEGPDVSRDSVETSAESGSFRNSPEPVSVGMAAGPEPVIEAPSNRVERMSGPRNRVAESFDRPLRE